MNQAVIFCGSCFVGCAAAHPVPAIEQAQVASGVAPAAAPSAPPLAARGTAAPGASAAPSAAPSVSPEAAAPLALPLTQLLSVPVSAIALGEGTRVAVLADVPYVGDARGLRPLPLPAMLRPKASEVERLGIFFGRDNEPRIMGSRRGEQGERAVYLRHLSTGWRDGREEIGQLGGAAPGGLWGVLGSADPELVCRVNATCIMKRNSGWTTAPAGALTRIVTLQDGVLWGLEAGGISGIDAHGWKLAIAAPVWSEPQAFWATRGEAWVSTERELFHYRAGQWATVPSPVGRVASFWGPRPDSVWVVGSAGAAHFDGRNFQSLAIAGPLSVVRGRGEAELWFGGQAGLYRALAAR
ncbi:MAG TPA: hypothetical protein VGC79_03495 [Polyangiaceae bacterium]